VVLGGLRPDLDRQRRDRNPAPKWDFEENQPMPRAALTGRPGQFTAAVLATFAEDIEQFAGPVAGGAALGGLFGFVLAEIYRFGWMVDVPGDKWVYYGAGAGGLAGLVAQAFAD
jgi:hypothetical protein